MVWLKRDYFQRNKFSKGLNDADDDDLILISDLDEIPNLEILNFKNKITLFEQKIFYYKFNFITKF